MQRALKVVRPEPENCHLEQSAPEPMEKTTLVGPSLGQLSDWKTWPPALAMVDQVIPFMVETSNEFLTLQRIMHSSLRRLSLFVDLTDCSIDPALVDKFVAQQILIPTDTEETFLVNLYGCLQWFISCSGYRPLSLKRHEYDARTVEAIEWDFHDLDFPVVTLELPRPKISPRPDKPRTAPWHPRRLPDRTTSQAFEFIDRFWDIMTEGGDDLMNLFVMSRLLELSVGRKRLQQFTTTVDIIQYGEKGFSIGLPDLGSSEYVHRMIQQILDECRLRAFNVLRHQTNPYAYYVQFDPTLKKHCRS